MAPDADSYTLPDLCDLAAVTSRTVRYYITQGLLRSPAGAGPGARYDTGHLARLRLIRRLQKDHLPLAEIRRRLAALSDAEAIALADEPAHPPSGSALDYIRAALSTRGVKPAASTAQAMPPSPAMAPPLPIPRQPASPAAAPRRDATLGVDAWPDAASPPGAAKVAEDLRAWSAEPDGAPDRSQWERITLDTDIELHVRRPLSRAHSRAVDRLVQAARQILQEDLP